MDDEKKSESKKYEHGKNPKSLGNLKPWKPGQSGNPAGRPKGKSITSLRRQDLKRKAAEVPYATTLCKNLGLDPEKATIGDVLAATANYHAIRGEASYYRENLNRDEGKVADKIRIENPLENKSDEELERIVREGEEGSD